MSWHSEAEKRSSPRPAHRNWQLCSEYCGRSETQGLPAKAEISNGLAIFLHQVVSVKINLLIWCINFLFFLALGRLVTVVQQLSHSHADVLLALPWEYLQPVTRW